MKEEKINLQKCLPSKERILRMAAYNRIVRSFRSSHFTEELQAHKMWRITNLADFFDPVNAPRVPDYRGQFPMFLLPEIECAQSPQIADLVAAFGRATSEAEGSGAAETQCDADGDVETQLEGICVVCIEKSALFVMHECGHLIFCPGCRRKAVAKELRESGKTQWKGVKPGQLSNKELERTKVRCPICREQSAAVAQKKFSGKVYT